jgi:hypothetical protein
MADWIGGLIIALGVLALVEGIPRLIRSRRKEKDREKEIRKKHELWSALDSIGYVRGMMDMSPEIPDEFENSLDTFDQTAFFAGWSRGAKDRKHPGAQTKPRLLRYPNDVSHVARQINRQ